MGGAEMVCRGVLSREPQGAVPFGAREGAAVMLVDANAAALQATLTALRQAWPAARLASHVADVSDLSAAHAAVAQTLRELGALDTLVNNAAMRNYTAAADVSAAEWQAIVAALIVSTIATIAVTALLMKNLAKPLPRDGE